MQREIPGRIAALDMGVREYLAPLRPSHDLRRRFSQLPPRCVGVPAYVDVGGRAGIRDRSGENEGVEEAPFDEAHDASRRTRLANERTYLAWWRTGLTALAVGVGAGRLVPALSKGAAWPYEVIGVAFAAVGIAFIVNAYVRQRQVENAVARGEYAPLRDRMALVFAVLGLLLGVATIVLVVANPE